VGCTIYEAAGAGRHEEETAVAVKVVVLADSDREVQRLIEPLSETGLQTIRFEPTGPGRENGPVSARLGRITLDRGLVLYLLGTTDRASTAAVRDELLPGSIGAVVIDETGVDETGGTGRAPLSLADLGLSDGLSDLGGRPYVVTTGGPHHHPLAGLPRDRARQVLIQLVQQALDRHQRVCRTTPRSPRPRTRRHSS
jgi:hypothetical protein